MVSLTRLALHRAHPCRDFVAPVRLRLTLGAREDADELFVSMTAAKGETQSVDNGFSFRLTGTAPTFQQWVKTTAFT